MFEVVEVLALDVSSTATGYAYRKPNGRVDFGLIKPPWKHKAIARIDEMVLGIERLLHRHPPKLVLMEWSSGKVHGRIAKASGLSVLGAAQGAIRQAILAKGIPVETVEENAWTKGKSKAKRAAVMAFVFPAYGEDARVGNDPGMDIADALGLLEWHRGQALTASILERAAK